MAPQQGNDNLRRYVFEALLPRMRFVPAISDDDDDIESLSSLSVRPERHRQLERIRSLDDTAFRNSCHTWAVNNIPNFPLGIEDEDMVTGKRLTIPASPSFNLPALPLGCANDIDRVSVWLDQLPFETVGRLLHIVYANTDNWKFVLQEDDETDYKIFRHYLWTTNDFPKSLISEQSVVVIVQPPWILTAKDLHEFADCPTFPVCPYPAHSASDN